MHIHDPSNPGIQRSPSRPIFWQRDLQRSQLHCAMRKSRQPRCTAANSRATAQETPKLLEADQNFG
jgi:hypothetical protein